MNELTFVFNELNALQSQLKRTVNRLWSIQLDLGMAYAQGQNETDFLPRRLNHLKNENTLKFEKLLRRFNHLITAHLGKNFLVFRSSDDTKLTAEIRTMLRYIQNAYVTELPILQNLARVNRVLTGHS
jgi:hypothetical protein